MASAAVVYHVYEVGFSRQLLVRLDLRFSVRSADFRRRTVCVADRQQSAAEKRLMEAVVGVLPSL